MKKQGFILFLFSAFLGCDKDENLTFGTEVFDKVESIIDYELEIVEQKEVKKELKILSLGDSYTIGSGVCDGCNYPEQLRDGLLAKFDSETTIELEILATNGWTTTNLINAFESKNFMTDYDLVTLLIGVNNQYQGQQFSVFESEFKDLVDKAIFSSNKDKTGVIVLSIPDYAYTPFGNQNIRISEDIDKYNLFSSQYCFSKGISFLDITDISREGIQNPELVASDDLHLSKLAYAKIVERLLPMALNKISN